MASAYLQRIAVAVPDHDIHDKFVKFAEDMLQDARAKALFGRLASKSGIQHRYSCLGATGRSGPDAFDVYGSGNFPTTRRRMEIFEQCAPLLVHKALDRLSLSEEELSSVRHVIVTCCTGLYAPGLDFAILDHLHLPASTERTIIGFMGCYAAMNALRTARHIVRSNPTDTVLVVSLELCSLHFQPTQDLNDVLSFLLFADGCSAALVGTSPIGFEMRAFQTLQIAQSRDCITWRIGDMGFDMYLSSQVPRHITAGMRQHAMDLPCADDVDLWAVHPGGRAILDAVETGLGLSRNALAPSRRVLQDFGNMSSATVMFVLQQLMQTAICGQSGCAMSFGPGLTAEVMQFYAA